MGIETQRSFRLPRQRLGSTVYEASSLPPFSLARGGLDSLGDFEQLESALGLLAAGEVFPFFEEAEVAPDVLEPEGAPKLLFFGAKLVRAEMPRVLGKPVASRSCLHRWEVQPSLFRLDVHQLKPKPLPTTDPMEPFGHQVLRVSTTNRSAVEQPRLFLLAQGWRSVPARLRHPLWHHPPQQ